MVANHPDGDGGCTGGTALLMDDGSCGRTMAVNRTGRDGGCTGGTALQPEGADCELTATDRREEATEEAGDMEAAGRNGKEAEEVGDLVTSVNPAMARGAMPWWG